jgi:hypothetical protein
MAMFAFMRRKVWRILAIAIAVLLLVAAALTIIAVAWLNPQLTRYIESDRFRAELEKETAKGLHFPGAHYEPIKRTGTWTAESGGFQAKDGWKALKTMDARGITARFNPWGVFHRLWQLDEVHVRSGEVGIQIYEPTPEPSPAKPWYAVFLPERVYLNWVESDPVDVTWRFREKPSGFYGTRLLITPHDHDFEYQGRGGQLKMLPFPEMRLLHTHMLITKTLLTLYNLDLEPNAQVNGRIHATGTAGTREDKSVDFKIDMDRVPVGDWLPETWREHITGAATARIHWTGKDPKMASSGGDATLRVENGRIGNLDFLRKIATLADDKSLENIQLSTCQVDVNWRYPKFDAEHLIIEEKGKFRAEGEVIVRKESLRGTIDLGVTRRLLNFLPAPVVAEVFPRDRGDYLWTTVHLSGTIENPQQDLSERVSTAIKEHPTAALTLLFRQITASLRHAFGNE